jgi:uncharacterized membrane protein (DUF4010 family)
MSDFFSIILQLKIPSDYDTTKLITGMLISVGIGILLGIEREFSHKRDVKDDSTNKLFAGIRTYPLITLLGYLLIFMSGLFNIWVFILGLLGILSYLGIYYYHNTKLGHTGTTSEFSVIISYILGALVYLDFTLLAVGIGVFLTVVLAFKLKVHWAVGELNEEDIHALIQFVIMAALILPVLPDTDYGPDGVLNPRKIGLIIVLLTGLNFVGYLLSKFIDTGKSIILTGVLGGFVSSTAVAWQLSRQSKSGKGSPAYQSVAVIVASSIMFLRVGVLLYILNQELFFQTIIGMLLVAAVGIFIGFFIISKVKEKNTGDEVISKNPLNILDALKFAGIYVAILLLVALAKQNLGSAAVLALSAVSGLTDVDAVVISMANLGGNTLEMNTALIGVFIALTSNTLVKYSMCLIFGKPEMKKFSSYGFIPVFITFALYVIIKTTFF